MKIILVGIFLLFSHTLFAEEITNLQISENVTNLDISWNAHGQSWLATLDKDIYFGDAIPIISLSVTTGNEKLEDEVENHFYRGPLKDVDGNLIPESTIFVDLSDSSIPFTGFVAAGDNMYVIEKDGTYLNGIRMRLEPSSNNTDGSDDIENVKNGWGAGGSGGALKPTTLWPRNRTDEMFPTLDIYVDPKYITKIGVDNYVSRIVASMAVANTMYSQSNLNQIHLLGIVLPDEDLGRTDSQGNIIHALEKIRKYTVTTNSADGSIVFSGNDFSMPSLWGWAELGFGCELQNAIEKDVNINTHQIGKGSAGLIDLPTLIQRGWILGHEFTHIIGGFHVYPDPLFYGFFQPQLALKDYVSTCPAKGNMYRSCTLDSSKRNLVDFYACP